MPHSVDKLAALGRLFEEHRPRLRALIQRRIDPALNARLDADEIIQETFLAAHRKWDYFAEHWQGSPFAWLYRLAQDCLIEAHRHTTRRGRDPGLELPWPEHSSIQLGLGLVGSSTGPGEAVARAEFQDKLRDKMKRTLDLLRDGDRTVLLMHHFDELTIAEAAEVLGEPVNRVAVRHVRALRRLRELWHQLERADHDGHEPTVQ